MSIAQQTEHFVSLAEHEPDWIRHVLKTGIALRSEREQSNAPLLAGKTLLMIFEKPSLRTRISFEQAMYELGGHAIVQAGSEISIGKRESPADVARVVNGMVQGICARVFDHQILVDLARHSTIPVINALSDDAHPCQALADIMTMIDEFGEDLSGRTLAYIGDGNNVAKSLAVICGKLGVRFVIAAPQGYQLDQAFTNGLRADVPNIALDLCSDPVAAVRNADAVYTDTWVSMGQEEEKAKRLAAFDGFQINDALLDKAPDHAIVLHCLPAYRGIEITDSVMDGPRSRCFAQAHNRLHAQKGLLAVLMGGK